MVDGKTKANTRLVPHRLDSTSRYDADLPLPFPRLKTSWFSSISSRSWSAYRSASRHLPWGSHLQELTSRMRWACEIRTAAVTLLLRFRKNQSLSILYLLGHTLALEWFDNVKNSDSEFNDAFFYPEMIILFFYGYFHRWSFQPSNYNPGPYQEDRLLYDDIADDPTVRLTRPTWNRLQKFLSM